MLLIVITELQKAEKQESELVPKLKRLSVRCLHAPNVKVSPWQTLPDITHHSREMLVSSLITQNAEKFG